MDLLGLRNLSGFSELSLWNIAVTVFINLKGKNANMIFLWYPSYWIEVSLVSNEMQSKILINLEDNMIAITHACLNKVIFVVRWGLHPKISYRAVKKCSENQYEKLVK